MWKFISNEPNENESLSEATEIFHDKLQKNKGGITKKSPKNTLQRKRQKFSADYRGKSFDDIRLMIVELPTKMDSANQRNEVISYMVLTRFLKYWVNLRISRILDPMPFLHHNIHLLSFVVLF